MALPADAATRTDQLRADLRRVAAQHATKVQAPHSSPMFTVDGEGTVRDRQGTKLYEPAPK
jgi:hypothetical protein